MCMNVIKYISQGKKLKGGLEQIFTHQNVKFFKAVFTFVSDTAKV